MAFYKSWHQSLPQPLSETSVAKEQDTTTHTPEFSIAFGKASKRKLNKELKTAGLDITLPDLGGFLHPSRVNIHDCKKAITGDQTAILRVKRAYEYWQQQPIGSIAAQAITEQKVPKAEAEIETTEQTLSNLLQQIKAIQPSPGSAYTQPLTSDICKDGGERTYDSELEKLAASIDKIRQGIGSQDERAKTELKQRQKWKR